MRGISRSGICEHRLALPAVANLDAVVGLPMSHARHLMTAAAHELDVRDVDVGLDVDDPALVQLLTGARALGAGALVLLGHGDAVDHHARLTRQHADDAAFLAAILARDHADQVVFADVDSGHLQHLRCERDDLHESLLAQLTRDGPEDAGAARVLGVGREDHDRVVVETDVGAVGPTALLGGAHDDRLDDVALLDGAAGQGVLDGGDDHVANARVAAGRPAEDADAQDLFGPCVVRDLAARFLLDHSARSTISTTRQRLDLLMGLVSITRTVSPTCASLVSSCAASLDERRTVLPYSAWRTWRSIRTMTVLSMASDTTTPVRTLRRARSLVCCSLTARSPHRWPGPPGLPRSRRAPRRSLAREAPWRCARPRGADPSCARCCPASRSPAGSAG